jgi:flavodoxin
MKIIIIYDSVFGNTEQIALAVARSLNSGNNIETYRVKDVKPEHLKNVSLLVVGSPTRQFRATPDIGSFLSGLPADSLRGVKVAGFDTRLTLSTIKLRVFRYIVDKGGYAAKLITEQLVKKGGKLLCPPEGFFVSGEEGPLETGESERASEWAKNLPCLSSS